MPETACRFLASEFRAERHTLAKIPRAAGLTVADTAGVDPAEAHMATNCTLEHEILEPGLIADA
jgi:hypothetical protein